MRKVKKFFEIVGRITTDAVYELLYFLNVNMRYFAGTIDIALPYCMYIMGQRLAVYRGGVRIGLEIFIPVLCTVLAHYMREFANITGKGKTIPVPEKRFTKVSDDGEVTIDNSRIQELILYMADLEDYMQRKRWL